MTINEIVHKALMLGIGVPEKVKELVDEVSKSGDELNNTVSELINKTLEKMNIPTADEVGKLQKKMTALSARVKKLEESTGA
jgi:polyhydroxyalkanoate synthesis regulator phasin